MRMRHQRSQTGRSQTRGWGALKAEFCCCDLRCYSVTLWLESVRTSASKALAGYGWYNERPLNAPGKNTGPWDIPEFPWLAAKLNSLEGKYWQRRFPCAPPGMVGPNMIQGLCGESEEPCSWKLSSPLSPPTAQISSVIPIYVNVSQSAEPWMITQTPFST